MKSKNAVYLALIIEVTSLSVGKADGRRLYRDGIKIDLNPSHLFNKIRPSQNSNEVSNESPQKGANVEPHLNPGSVNANNTQPWLAFSIDPRASEWKTNTTELSGKAYSAWVRGDILQAEHYAILCAYGLTLVHFEKQQAEATKSLAQENLNQENLMREIDVQRKFGNALRVAALDQKLHQCQLESLRWESLIEPPSNIGFAQKLQNAVGNLELGGSPNVRQYGHLIAVLCMGSGGFTRLPSRLSPSFVMWRGMLADVVVKQNVSDELFSKTLLFNDALKEIENLLIANKVRAAQEKAQSLWAEVIQ
jgi:hypothetical protein